MLFKNPINGRILSPTPTLLFECDTQTQICLQQKTLLYKITILEFSQIGLISNTQSHCWTLYCLGFGNHHLCVHINVIC